ncbi:hypothetical protein V6N11_045983 [Hibiscus sabdariffa]|uniref:Uncharacterized protein n=2 Tax=Hibiscus sabdariffa TaxID=183260 RepID=A0ABR2BKY4_9ROSI
MEWRAKSSKSTGQDGIDILSLPLGCLNEKDESSTLVAGDVHLGRDGTAGSDTINMLAASDAIEAEFVHAPTDGIIDGVDVPAHVFNTVDPMIVESNLQEFPPASTSGFYSGKKSRGRKPKVASLGVANLLQEIKSKKNDQLERGKAQGGEVFGQA